MLAVAGCGAAEADRSATSGGATTAAPGAAGDAPTPKLFACSRESRVFGPPPAVPEAGRLTRIVRRVDAFRGEGYNARARGEGCAGGVAGPGSAGLAFWQEAGAVLLSWKAPLPDEIAALEGQRPDGCA